MVQKLLDERQEMLLMFCRVAGLEPFKNATPSADVLQEFCQVLVDYSAFGHFEIYERIVAGVSAAVRWSRWRARSTRASRSHPRWRSNSTTSTTHPITTLDLQQLDRDLCKLGEEIAVRIEMEDHIIRALTSR